MNNKLMFHALLGMLAMTMSMLACAEIGPRVGKGDFSWFAETGLGYDSNPYHAPSNAYFDYGVGATQNTTVVPQVRSGFFVPFTAHVDVGRQNEKNGRLIGLVTVDGRRYLGSVSDANELNLEARGGSTFDLGGKGNSERQAYAGLVLEKHDQVYVDHDSGDPKITAGGSDISNRYNYTSAGIEGEYQSSVGGVDYTISSQYLQNDYDDPVVVSQMDHNFFSIGGDADLKLGVGMKLKFLAEHYTRDYTERHARTANGVYATANPVLKYTYNKFGVTFRERLNEDTVYYLDYNYLQRADNYVNYNDYKLHRFGGRFLFKQDALSGRVSLHRWQRNYPNAFAFDIAGQPAKSSSGIDLSVKAGYAQSKQFSLWAEVILDKNDSSDKRYAYDRKQLLVGVRWDQ